MFYLLFEVRIHTNRLVLLLGFMWNELFATRNEKIWNEQVVPVSARNAADQHVVNH